MSTLSSSRPASRPIAIKFITLAVIASCLAVGLYLATSFIGGLLAQSEPEPPTPPEGYFTTTISSAYYDFLDGRAAGERESYQEFKQAYTSHIDTHFKVFLKEDDGQLRISINTPPIHYPTGMENGAFRYELWDDLAYDTVSNPADCQANVFGNSHRVIDAEAETSLPLSASDYGSYYCIKLKLEVKKPGADWWPAIIFVADEPIDADGLNTHLDDFPGFSRTMVQDTDYHDTSWFTSPPTKNTDYSYRDHLNDHFHLFAEQTDDSFELKLNLPGHLALAGGRDINEFELEEWEYAVVAQRNDCNRQLFETGDTTNLSQTTSEASLNPVSSDYASYYCVRARISGERSLSSDTHSDRIFYIPEAITSVAPDDIWRHL